MQEENNSIAIFRKNLFTALKARGMTQAQLAEVSGVLQGNISNYLTGRREPKAAQLHQISQALGVTMEWLLAGDSEPPAPPLQKGTAKISRTQIRKAIKDARSALDRLESELDPKE